MATRKGSKRQSGGKVSAGGGLGSIVKTGKKVLGMGGGSGRTTRRKGVEYWAKKVLVERLKKKYFKTKYGSIK